MNIKPIKTKADYRTALKTIESWMMAKPNMPEGERLDVLVTPVEAYERKHYPLDLPGPVEAIKFTMEQRGLGVTAQHGNREDHGHIGCARTHRRFGGRHRDRHAGAVCRLYQGGEREMGTTDQGNGRARRLSDAA